MLRSFASKNILSDDYMFVGGGKTLLFFLGTKWLFSKVTKRQNTKLNFLL